MTSTILSAQARKQLEDRIEESQRMIGRMCSDGRSPLMSIPVRPDRDEDVFICDTLNQCLALLASLPAVEVQPVADVKRLPGCVKPDTDKQVFFYEQDFYVLSNFSAFNLQWIGLTFPTSEHAYHWLKFNRPGDDQHDIRAMIRMAPSAHEAFKIAERHKGARRDDWDAVKVPTMREILRAKAAQHEYVRRKLLATDDRELIEDSWRDDFWGWGPNRDGQNMLGKLWMEVRAELRGQS